MPAYYLDIETTGLDPMDSEIITIQYQELGRGTGAPMGDITILRAWETGEGAILERFVADTPITDPYPFAFMPVGYNLKFEDRFLRDRSRHHGLPEIGVIGRPHIDLHSVGVLMNGGEFSGSSLSQITGKLHNGNVIGEWYREKQYDKIDGYIRNETQEFVKFYRWLLLHMPAVRESWKKTGL